MFRPDERKDRINYCNLLSCPDGYNLDFAVGTTYSLDLETLAAVCMAMGIECEPTDSLMNNPIALLNAFQKVSDKILIFSEPGQIKVPNHFTKLDFLLEKMVVPVLLEKDAEQNRYPAFHPKTWLLKFKSFNGDVKYRLLVLSRNLTFDRSWDFSFAINGSVCYEDKEPNSKNISVFLRFLTEHLPDDMNGYEDRKSVLSKLCKELENVYFDTETKDFYDFQFMPLGIGKKSFDLSGERLLNKNFDDLVVVSPFISNEIMTLFNYDNRKSHVHKRTLIARDFSLKNIGNKNLSHFDVYTVKDTIFEGEESLSEDTNSEELKQNQDIHAKMYLLDYKKDSYFYFGSANATHNGFYKNVETLVRVNAKKYNCRKLRNDLFRDKEDKNPFQKINLEDIELVEKDKIKAEQDRLEQIIKDICHLEFTAAVTKKDDNLFELKIRSDKSFDFNGVDISLLNSGKKQAMSKETVFSDLELMDLSEFYVLNATSSSVEDDGKKVMIQRVVKIPTSPIPEEREKNVIKSVINNRDTFFEYISYVLSDDYILTSLDAQKKKLQGLDHSDHEEVPAIYEQLLKACLIDKDRIGQLKYIMSIIDDKEIIPDEFRQIYSVFVSASGEKND